MKSLLAGTCLALAAAPLGLVAAQSSITVTVEMPVEDVFALSIAPGSTPLGTPTWADFAAGYRNAAAPVVLTARANRSFKVSISAAPTFAFLGAGPDPSKPRSDLQWALSAGGSFTSIGTGGTVLSGGSAIAEATQSVYYRTLWDIEHAPAGDYSLLVSFTISAP